MMFKTTTVLALVATLAPSALAVPTDSGFKVETRQEPGPTCPRSDNACGFYLLDPGRGCLVTEQQLRNLGEPCTADPWDSIYRVDAAGVPVECVQACPASCEDRRLQGDPTHCAGLPAPPAN